MTNREKREGEETMRNLVDKADLEFEIRILVLSLPESGKNCAVDGMQRRRSPLFPALTVECSRSS
jgi:hypothetical protein